MAHVDHLDEHLAEISQHQLLSKISADFLQAIETYDIVDLSTIALEE